MKKKSREIVDPSNELAFLKPHELGLCCAYGISVLTVVGLVHNETLQHKAVVCMTVSIWTGFVLSISLMEAWVKFKAPTLKKYIAVDVGRHVFKALNIAECALLGCIWCLHVVVGGHSTIITTSSFQAQPVLLSLLTFIVVIETSFLSGLLNLRAKMLIVKEIQSSRTTSAHTMKEDELSKRQLLAASLTKSMRGASMPPPQWHILYILLEVIKAIILLYYGYELSTQ